jgi:hypothetical protein
MVPTSWRRARATPRTVTMQNGGAGGTARLETFSSASGPDHPGWSFGAWSLASNLDATGTPGSRSLTATASPRFGTIISTASWAGLSLGSASTLSYQRQLAFSNANVLASSAFRVIINDGTDHIVDEKLLAGLGTYRESTWAVRAAIDLAAFAGKTVTLKVVVTARDSSSTLTSASAWIDQVQLR